MPLGERGRLRSSVRTGLHDHEAVPGEVGQEQRAVVLVRVGAARVERDAWLPGRKAKRNGLRSPNAVTRRMFASLLLANGCPARLLRCRGRCGRESRSVPWGRSPCARPGSAEPLLARSPPTQRSPRKSVDRRKRCHPVRSPRTTTWLHRRSLRRASRRDRTARRRRRATRTGWHEPPTSTSCLTMALPDSVSFAIRPAFGQLSPLHTVTSSWPAVPYLGAVPPGGALCA